ncbi:MAG: histidine phosphatase family protein [Prevotellaceae bacterium]|jgi:probable phosphoglycerate mutase|nr:histidine phosphatase family protein [Prevotellaceae bacterium]
MTKLYIARHGETEWNIQRRFQGQHDSPLTANGINQVNLLSEYLKNISVDAIYTSSCKRAVVTANIINSNKNLPLYVCEELREINMGEWEGMPANEIKLRYADEFQHFFYQPDLYMPDNNGGETFDSFRLRLSNKIEEIVLTHPDKTILIVVHGIALRILLAYFKNCSLSEIWNFLAKPASISLVTANDKKYEINFWAKTEY